MAKQEIEIHGQEVDEMDFSSIGKTLSKYGKGVGSDPVTPKRSTVHTDYTMTGHKEGKSSTGRVYTKAPEMDREAAADKATVKTGDPETPKRGRGRPVGATNKAGTGKGWSAEAKASMKAKLAARKAAKLAANESVEIDESHNGTFKTGDVVSVDYHDIAGKTHHGTTNVDKATKAYVHVRHPSISGMTLKFHQTVDGKNTANEVGTLPGTRMGGHKITKIAAKNESIDLTEEDWADILEGQSLDSIVEFMLDEEFQSLDELSKATLGSYIKKASKQAQGNAIAAMHAKNREAEARSDAEYYRKAKEPENAKIKDAYADSQHKASYNATETSIKRLNGVAKATDRLTKESEELDEATIATQWKQKVKAVHGKDVTFQKSQGQTIARNSAGKLVGYHDHETGRNVVDPKIAAKVAESVELDEAVAISHDRFERSHGTKAKDKGPARWMFTSKRYGAVNHKDETEFHEAPHGSFADAKKSAKAWAKKHGHDTAYVMESTEDLNIQRYVALLGKNLIKE